MLLFVRCSNLFISGVNLFLQGGGFMDMFGMMGDMMENMVGIKVFQISIM